MLIRPFFLFCFIVSFLPLVILQGWLVPQWQRCLSWELEAQPRLWRAYLPCQGSMAPSVEHLERARARSTGSSTCLFLQLRGECSHGQARTQGSLRQRRSKREPTLEFDPRVGDTSLSEWLSWLFCTSFSLIRYGTAEEVVSSLWRCRGRIFHFC